jgi:precorrin-6Y C5,15-methyltransferase (decarboxylating)
LEKIAPSQSKIKPLKDPAPDQEPGPTVTVLGLDDPGDLSPSALGLLGKAQVVAGPARLLEAVSGHLTAEAQKIPLVSGLNHWLGEVKKSSSHGQMVILADGDPNFFGLGARVIEVFDDLRVTMKPAPTTVQKAFARMGVTWAGAEVVSLHGRQDYAPFFSAIFRAGQVTGSGFVAVYTDATNNPALIASKLIERGQLNWKMTVFQELGLPGEAIWSGDLAKAQKSKFSPLNLTVLERTKLPKVLTLGAPESAYDHQAGLITKSEVRTAILGLLELSGHETLWDLGCGSGSVSLDAGLLLRHGQVLSVEKDPQRAAQARQNRSKYGLAHVEVIEGQALEAMADLPLPDRVFVGGGGRQLEYLIQGALSFLGRRGLIVVAVVRLDSLNLALSCLSSPDIKPTVTQISVSRGESLAKSIYLKPINPVFLIKGKIIEIARYDL